MHPHRSRRPVHPSSSLGPILPVAPGRGALAPAGCWCAVGYLPALVFTSPFTPAGKKPPFVAFFGVR
ncbi:hypothetical protein GCM10025868_27090 [Angustibacter aerolatus]|uniref:Uncharacterized protein n=1 Tax=Angustibacter aerolatus TaxID=1162965 RepID=A0ABQ6JJB2_9ACTN|nr:hypothetical protein GCM10025868_27090 [Angustibacter aerolatus]